MRRRWVLVSTVAIVASGCGSPATPDRAATSSTRATTTTPATTTPATTTPPTTKLPGSPTLTPSSTGAQVSVTTTPTSGDPPFESQILELTDAVKRRMNNSSMRPGCPVGFDALRYLRLGHWTFDNEVQVGEMVVHRDVALAVVGVFKRLFEARYPIERMQLVDDFGAEPNPSDGASDFRSIEANNTSAFNCRTRTGSATTFSQHAFGTAIDINPIQNPYVTRSGTTSHDASVSFLDRTIDKPGVIREGDIVVTSFDAVGWGWGGRWDGIKDYQHFSASGQ